MITKITDRSIYERLFSGLLIAVFCVLLVNPVQVVKGLPVDNAPADYEAFFDAALPEQLAREHIAGATVTVVQGSENQQRYPLGEPLSFLFLPALLCHNRYFCGLSGFPLNNQKKCIRPPFAHNQPLPVHRQCFPWYEVKTVFQDGNHSPFGGV